MFDLALYLQVLYLQTFACLTGFRLRFILLGIWIPLTAHYVYLSSYGISVVCFVALNPDLLPCGFLVVCRARFGELDRKSFDQFRNQGPDKYAHYDRSHEEKSKEHGEDYKWTPAVRKID